MAHYKFRGLLQKLIDKAISGHPEDIDFIMSHLTSESNLAMTRYIDFALSQVENEEGMKRIEHYLFKGTLIQRNYACLFLNRLHIWQPIKKAFELGLIDEVQAYAR